MKHFLVFLLVLLLAVGAMEIVAQDVTVEETDFARLMKGEEVHLNWGDEPVVLDRTIINPPPAGELLILFLDRWVEEEDTFTEDYIIDQLLMYMAPDVVYGNNGPLRTGLAATSMRWDETTKTLYVQASRYLPYDPEEALCGGGLGHPYPNHILHTQLNHCDNYAEEGKQVSESEYSEADFLYKLGGLH